MIRFRGWDLDDDDDEADLQNVFTKRVKAEPESPKSSQNKGTASLSPGSQQSQKTSAILITDQYSQIEKQQKETSKSSVKDTSTGKTSSKQKAVTPSYNSSSKQSSNIKQGSNGSNASGSSTVQEMDTEWSSDDDIDSVMDVMVNKRTSDISQSKASKDSNRRSPSPGPTSQQRNRSRSPVGTGLTDVRVKTEKVSPKHSTLKAVSDNPSEENDSVELNIQTKREQTFDREVQHNCIKFVFLRTVIFLCPRHFKNDRHYVLHLSVCPSFSKFLST